LLLISTLLVYFQLIFDFFSAQRSVVKLRKY
jgi:hypothetical protein